MNKLKLISLFLILIAFTACTNIKNAFTNTFETPSNYTVEEITAFNVNQKTELFALGSYKISESGTEIAQMKANTMALTELEKSIFRESKKNMNSFFDEIKVKNIVRSSKMINDYANLATSRLMRETKIKKTWNKADKEYVVLYIKKNTVFQVTKDIFFKHVNSILYDLNRVKNRISEDALNISEPAKVETIIAEPMTTTINILNKDKATDESSSDSPKQTDDNKTEILLEDF